MSVKVGSHVMGKSITDEGIALVCPSVRLSKEDSELECHSLLEASLYVTFLAQIPRKRPLLIKTSTMRPNYS